jgi:nitrite reductase/ring-hydroxylating ferredoxin subunit
MKTIDVEVAKASEVKEGEVKVVKAEGRSIALTRVKGNVQAFENKCPHLGLSLARGKLEDGVIRCPFHGSRFDVCSGKNVDWVNSIAGIPLPKFMQGIVAFGKKPQAMTTFPAQEAGGAVSVRLPV